MEKSSWTDRVKNEDVSYRVNEDRNILHVIERRKLDWSHLALELPHTAWYRRKYRRKDGSGGKTRKRA
jgi:hypothetical protein